MIPARVLGRDRLKTPEELANFRAEYGLDQSLAAPVPHLPAEHLHRPPRRLDPLPGAGERPDHGPALADGRCWSARRRCWRCSSASGSASSAAGTAARPSTGPRPGSRSRSTRCPSGGSGCCSSPCSRWDSGRWTGIFPTGQLHSNDVDPSSLEGVLDTAWHLVLPVITLTLAYLAEYSLVMRSSLLDEIGEDYLTTARAKGLRDVVVRRRHAVRNALLPTTTVVRAQLRLRGLRGAHHRDGVLDPRAWGCSPPRRSPGPTTGCCRAPSWSRRPASSSPTSWSTCSTACSTRGCAS